MLGSLPAVGRGGVFHTDGDFFFAEQQAVDELDALHEAVVCIGNFIFPHAKAATGVNVDVLEEGYGFGKDFITLDGGDGVTVVGVVDPGADDVGGDRDP